MWSITDPGLDTTSGRHRHSRDMDFRIARAEYERVIAGNHPEPAVQSQ
jgi:hypothetical protein